MNKKTVLVLLLAIAAMFGARASAAPMAVIREIKSPTFSAPHFAAAGGVTPVTLALPGPGSADSAEIISVVNPAKKYSVKLGEKIASAGEASLKFKLPAKIAPGLYDLCILFTTGGSPSKDCQRHSVAVVKSFSAPFKFVQITDYHYGDPRANRQFPGVDIAKVRVAALEAANRAKPAFVLFTGDICAYPETYDEDYPAAVEEIVSHLKVPALILPGNHDLYGYITDKGKLKTDGAQYWHDFFGPTHQIIDYGKMRFILFNSYDWDISVRNHNFAYTMMVKKAHSFRGTMSPAELKWLKDAIESAGGRKITLAAHHSPDDFEQDVTKFCADCLGEKAFYAFVDKYKIPNYIYGHVHADKDYVKGATRYVSTTSSGSDVNSKKELWAVRVFSVSKDLKMSSKLVRLFDAPPMK